MKKLLALILVLLMAAAVLPAQAESLPADDLTQHRSMTAFLQMDDYQYFGTKDESPVMQYLMNKFNFSIEFMQPPVGSEAEGFNNMLGSGVYTDLMEITYSSQLPSVLYADGVIMDLAPYLETYMPNYYAFLHDPANEDVYKAMYDSEGHCFTITTEARDDTPNPTWGGMVYRRDILETMTGGNIAFPSGNDEPMTVADWEYMLDLMKAYFDATGMSETAPLIIPYQGFFNTGELVSGFGCGGGWQVADGKVGYGPTTPEFYNYLCKMREWYEKGYIYQDFASRVNDLFYQPNMALTYGGAAGTFFGGYWQLADKMSMPEYGLNMDIRAASAPVDTENGLETAFPTMSLMATSGVTTRTGAWSISTACSKEKMIRFMTWADYLFSEEGAMIKSYGFTGDLAAADSLYQQLGLEKGTYWFDENGEFQQDPRIVSNEIDPMGLSGNRLPGINIRKYTYPKTEQSWLDADKVWSRYGDSGDYPVNATGTAEEESQLADYYNTYTDYQNSMVVKFIMGTEELTPESYNAYVEQMNKFGVEDSIRIKQEIYDRFMSF